MTAFRQWLEQHGLESLYQQLSEQDIDLDIIVDLSEDDLTALGLTLGKRKRLQRAIATLGGNAAGNTTLSPQAGSSEAAVQNTIENTPERRQLTVLFCDLVGSTELSQQLDLEDLRDVLLDYQTTVSNLFEAHRGFIARYMGDGVLVYFGYPAAMEDDAFSAVQAAQQILDAFQYSPRFVEAGFKVRIGIATGLVLAGEIVGSGASEEHTVLGKTPNLAARLQGVAGPNQMVVDDQTWNLVRRRYTANTLEMLTLKGFDYQVTAYEIPIQQPRSLFTQHEDNKLIGRDQELGIIKNAWQQAQQGKRQFVLINGEPGIGKSRLIREFGGSLQSASDTPNSNIVQWFCSPHSTNSAFFAPIQYLQDTCEFSANDTFLVKRSKIIDAADLLGLSTQQAERLSEVLLIDEQSAGGNMTPVERRAELINLLIEMFHALAERHPTTLMVEDLHAIDPSTLEFLQAFMARDERSVFLLLVSCRPEFDVAVFSEFKVQHVQLNPLADEECSRLISELGKLPASLAREILRKADGIPLYVEEITRALFEAAKQQLATDSNPGGIPSTLQSLLLARLDRLGSARELAQLAAVVGDDIDIDLLQQLSEKSDQELQRDLESLNASGVLVYSVGSNRKNFQFRHTLFQEVAYQTLLRDDRRRLHRQVGEAIRDGQPELANIQPERVARHFTAAHLPRQAIEFWHLAAKRASGMSANNECFSHIEAAKPLLGKLDSVSDRETFELELNIVHASVLRGTSGPGGDLIASVYERSLALCDSTGQKDKLVAPLNGLYIYNLLRARYSVATEYANRLLELANESGDVTSRMAGHRALGAVSFNTGELARASEHLQQSRELYDPQLHGNSAALIGADHLQVATSLYCATQCVRGYPDTALSIHIDELHRAQTLGHSHNTAQLLVFLTFHASMSARSETAHYCQQLYEISAEFNFPMMIASAQFFRGLLKMHRGETRQAYKEMKAGFVSYQNTGAVNYLPYFKMKTAEACLVLGEFEEAKQLLTESQHEIESAGEYWCVADWYRLQGEYELHTTKNKQLAASLFDQAIADAESRGAMLWMVSALQSRAALAHTIEARSDLETRISSVLAEWPELKGYAEMTASLKSNPELSAGH